MIDLTDSAKYEFTERRGILPNHRTITDEPEFHQDKAGAVDTKKAEKIPNPDYKPETKEK